MNETKEESRGSRVTCANANTDRQNILVICIYKVVKKPRKIGADVLIVSEVSDCWRPRTESYQKRISKIVKIFKYSLYSKILS